MEGGGGRVPGGRTQVPVRGGQVSDGTVYFDLLLGKRGKGEKRRKSTKWEMKTWCVTTWAMEQGIGTFVTKLPHLKK